MSMRPRRRDWLYAMLVPATLMLALWIADGLARLLHRAGI